MIDVRTPETHLTADTVRGLAERSVQAGRTTAFQGLLVTTLDAVGALRCPVAAAGEAALSLAHQQTIGAAVDDLDALAEALRAGVTEQGACLMPQKVRPADVLRLVLHPPPGWLPRLRARAADLAHPEAASRPTWVVAMAVAVEALGEAAERLHALARAQPEGSAARDLGTSVADRLRQHRDALLREVARLID